MSSLVKRTRSIPRCRMFDKIKFMVGIKIAKNERFEKVYSQGMLNMMEIWVIKKLA